MSIPNRAMLLTPPGAAAIAVVRLSGPLVEDFLRNHFSRTLAAGRCVHGTLSDAGTIIDDPVVVLSQDQRKADLSLHGGPWIVRRTLELARRAGFEVIPTLPLPLPTEAMDEDTQLAREVEAWLPLARTEMAVRVLLAQEQNWTSFIGKERGATGSDSKQAIGRVLQDRSLLHLLNPPHVVIAGAANVGKSTLANQLFAQERSITADLPGTTRDWVGELANVDGLAVMLLDTPGLRHTNDSIEQHAIDRSRDQIARANLLVLVLDASRPLEPEQAPLLSAFPAALRVVNKSDRAAVWDSSSLAAISTVATDGRGVGALRRAIAAHFGCADVDPSLPRCWTSRQRQILQQATEDCSKLQLLFETSFV